MEELPYDEVAIESTLLIWPKTPETWSVVPYNDSDGSYCGGLALVEISTKKRVNVDLLHPYKKLIGMQAAPTEEEISSGFDLVNYSHLYVDEDITICFDSERVDGLIAIAESSTYLPDTNFKKIDYVQLPHKIHQFRLAIDAGTFQFPNIFRQGGHCVTLSHLVMQLYLFASSLFYMKRESPQIPKCRFLANFFLDFVATPNTFDWKTIKHAAFIENDLNEDYFFRGITVKAYWPSLPKVDVGVAPGQYDSKFIPFPPGSPDSCNNKLVAHVYLDLNGTIFCVGRNMYKHLLEKLTKN